MESFTQHLRISALQAAKVAQTLATTRLDEMAAEDEYVQSEGFNTTRKVSRKPDDASSTHMSHHHHSFDQRSKEMIGDSLKNHILPSQPTKPPTSSSSSLALDPATDIRRQARHRPEDQTYLLSSSSDDEDNDAENDPILSILRQEKSTTNHRNHPEAPTRKDAHRFLDDLESRLSRPLEPDPPLASSSNSTNAPPSHTDGTMGLTAWLSTAATTMGIPSAKVRPPVPVAPLARHKPRPITGEPVPVELISSSTLLGESERQQLERLRSLEGQAAPGPLRRLYDQWLVPHRREMFIVLTLVLCAYVYFHATRV